MLFFYNDELKDNNLYLKNTADRIIEYFKNIQIELRVKHSILLSCMDNISNNIDEIQNAQDIEDTSILFSVLNRIKESFDAINFNMEKNRNFISSLTTINFLLENDSINDSIFSLIDEFNLAYDDEISKIQEHNKIVDDFISYYISNSMFKFQFAHSTKEVELENVNNGNANSINDCTKTDSIKMELNDNEKLELHDNNILIISEKDNLVYLPYKLDDVRKILDTKNKEYKDIEDVINKNYVISLDRFKNPMIARFRETFLLMRKREKTSISKSLDLALELSFNNLLNPAVICACKNLEELNIYLDYLSTNELEKFKIFDVRYDVSPQVVK